MSAILNRTLIIPPVLDHHAAVLGSCPKFRVSDPNELRFAVWNHAIELIQSHRYVSMADVIDLSSLVSDSSVRTQFSNYFVIRVTFTGQYEGSESYIDIHESPRDEKIQSLINKIEFLPFVPDILSAGKEYAFHTVKTPFLCAQLRLLDGQFKNHWKATFQGLKQKLDSLRQKEILPIHIFVMTDLPLSNWSGTYLEDLSNDPDSVKLFILTENDELIRKTAKKVVEEDHGVKLGAFFNNGIKNNCHKGINIMLPDILLHVEETVCSCASLGFVGTVGSTIADSIEIMRKKQICSR